MVGTGELPAAPFAHLRMRGLAGRLESGFDPKAQVANAMGLAVALPPVRSPAGGATGELNTSPQRRTRSSLEKHPQNARPSPTAATPGDITSALDELNSLRSQIVGVETVLGLLRTRGEGEVSTMGHQVPRAPTQAQLRRRADTTLTRTGGFSSMGGGTTRVRSAVSASEWDSHTNLSDGGFNSLVGQQELGRTWRQPNAVLPVGRGEAVILSAALDETMPAGAMAGKYAMLQNGYAGGAAEAFLVHQDIRKDFQAIDMVQAEAARQVAASCVERGDLVEKVRQRYEELFGSLSCWSSNLLDTMAFVTRRLMSAETLTEEQRSRLSSLKSEVKEKDTEMGRLQDVLATQTAAVEATQWDTDQQMEKLHGQNTILAAQVEDYQQRLADAADDKERALDEGLARLEEQLMLVGDQRDDLQQRIRFLERQVVRLRRDADLATPTASVEVQTDPVTFSNGVVDLYVEEVAPVVEAPSLASTLRPIGHLTNMLNGKENAPAAVKKRMRFLGHFQGLVNTERVGKVRGIAWTHSCISTLYYDKVINDAVADREGNPRAELCEFAYEWHLTRFGLKNLAELNLLDLISSARQHHKSSVRVRWFAQFVGLIEMGERVDTLQHVSFYIFCIQQLAYPNALMALFPDTDDIPVLIRATVVQDAVRAIFRYLNDVDSAVPFLTRVVEPITDLTTDPVTVPGDLLVKLLMAEFQKRVDRNVAHLRALFRAGDLDADGYITFDEFCSLLRHAAPDIQDRVVSKMYTEAVRALPDGVTMVDMDTFVATCRCYNFDRWKIEMPTPAMLNQRPSSAAMATSRGGEFFGDRQNAKTMMRLLDSAVEALDPPLDDQLDMAREACGRGGLEALLRIEAQAAHFKIVYDAHDDVQAAWLAFRILVSGIAAALAVAAAAALGPVLPVPVVAPSPGGKILKARVVPDTPWRSGATHALPISSSGPWDPGSVMAPASTTPSEHGTPHGSMPPTPSHGRETNSSPFTAMFAGVGVRSKSLAAPGLRLDSATMNNGSPRVFGSGANSPFSRPKAVTIGAMMGGYDPQLLRGEDSPPRMHDGSSAEPSPHLMGSPSTRLMRASNGFSGPGAIDRRRKSMSFLPAGVGVPDALSQVMADHLEHRGPLGPTPSLMPPSVSSARNSQRPLG